MLVEPAVIAKLLSYIKDGEANGIGSLSKPTVRSMTTSVTLGFMNMFETMKEEYLQLLTKSDHLNSLMNYLVTVAGASSLPFDQPLR